jgi:regulator of RNase E activity RraA
MPNNTAVTIHKNITTDNWTGSAVLGDLGAAMFNNIGLAGVVTDGAARDLAGIRQVGLPAYGRGLTANSSQKNHWLQKKMMYFSRQPHH